MKSYLVNVASLVGLVAMFGSLTCAFATFTTNDYRLVIAIGIGLSLLALACFGNLIWLRHRSGALYAIIGVIPTLVALGELLLRATSMIVR
jgi:hypothetical protein